MELQTKIDIVRPNFEINYRSSILMIGSCFTENIGEKLAYFKFNIDLNPCGIVYNPFSVANVLQLLLAHKRLTGSDLLPNNGKWVSLLHHGRFSALQAADCLKNINERLELSAARLKTTNVLIITWGTSWVYRYKENGMIVSNCHKFPAAAFDRFRLTVAEIVEKYTELIARLKTLTPDLQILFTVSPVRHWKDGAHGNQLSKSVLLLAIDELVRKFDCVSYFPAYEIVMDELRDYRFYAEDMLHPSTRTIDYIWEKFGENYLSKETEPLRKRIDKINKTLLHRSSDPDSPAALELQERLKKEIKEIEQEYGFTYLSTPGV
ncbi:MAG: GSCFA domain-containing protein [Odoribacter sp.]